MKQKRNRQQRTWFTNVGNYKQVRITKQGEWKNVRVKYCGD